MSVLKEIEIFAKNRVLDIFLRWHKAPKKHDLPKLDQNSTVVFLRLNQIGDALVATPVIKAIKEKYGCKTVIIADSKNHFVFKRNPYIDQIIVYKKKWAGFWQTIQQINVLKPNLVIDLHDRLSTTVSLLIGQIKSPYKFGITDKNAQIFTHKVANLDTSKYHVTERLFHVLSILDIFPKDINSIYEPAESSMANVKKFLGKKKEQKLIGINISAGSENRLWNVQNFRKLVALLEERKLGFVVLTPPHHLYLAEQITEKEHIFCSPVFDEFVAMISQLDVLFTPDTSAVHLASVFKIPVFGLFLTEHPNHINWFPYRSVYDWIISEPPIDKISFEQAWQKFEPFMKKIGVYS